MTTPESVSKALTTASPHDVPNLPELYSITLELSGHLILNQIDSGYILFGLHSAESSFQLISRISSLL